MGNKKHLGIVIGRVTYIVVLLFCYSSHTPAQDEKRKEIWPEVDVHVPLKPKLRLFFVGAITKNEETRDNTEGQVGAHVDFLIGKRFTLRAGYRYGFSLAGEDPYKEHRIIIEQTFRHPLLFKLLIIDRNREELRIVNGDFSARYRNRLTLERQFVYRKFDITPYGAFEVFYDTRFDTWNRNRLTAGIQFPLRRGTPLVRLIDPSRSLVLDIYYQRQIDSRSQPARVNGLGIALNIYL
jgi:hypothetical protein